MKRSHRCNRSLAAAVSLAGCSARADEAQVNQILDKAIKALGGEEKLGKAEAITVEGQGQDHDRGQRKRDHAARRSAQGLDHFQSNFEGEFNGNKFKGLSVLNGDKGWRKFGDRCMEMDQDAVKNEKRTVYLMVVPATILPLKSKGFKVESAAG